MTLKDEIFLILCDLNSACKESSIPASADMVLDCAVRIYNSRQINSKPEKPAAAQDFAATEKQISLLKKLGLEYKAGMTKKEANALISEKLGK